MSKSMEKKDYIAPQTKQALVELEQGFMSASVFDPEAGHDKGVSTTGHEFGNSGNYFDNSDDGMNTWDE